MSVTELRPEGETYAEGLAKASLLEAEAEAARIKNRAEAARQELLQEKAAARAQKEIEAELAEAADARRRRDEAASEEAAAKARAAASAATWRKAALSIAVVCVLVSLPLQVMAFYSPKAPFLVVAPLVIEGIAWALLAGAQAAIDEDRPAWLYRLLAGCGALFAASVNLLHGMSAYGLATGLGGAFCSLAGPLIWDLHEHGRLAKKEGRLPRKVRRAEARAARDEARRVTAVNAARANEDTKVWERAVYLAAALGEVAPKRSRLRRRIVGEVVPSERTYKRAWDEIHGAETGTTAETIAARRAARHAVRVASNSPLSKTEKDANAQVDSQMDPPAGTAPKAPRKSGEDGRRRNGGTPPRRVPGDVQYSPVARRQMSAAAKAAKAAETAEEVSPS
ncbi:hypothetical protein [Streptomyces sp. NPDC020983]|uniref:hypothetical protein n=1 Tax=Streptomyces sp. NPDC020983 TaxID=3365106 RepID=UPI00379572BC